MSGPGERRAWRTIAWACAAHVLSMTGFSTYPALLPRLQGEWGMSNAEAGLVSGLFFAGYMLAAPVLTSLTDRIDARRVYLCAALAVATGLAGMALAAVGVVSASLCLLLAGAGFAGTYMPGLKALTDNVSGPAQSRAVSFYTATFGVGISLSVMLAGTVRDAWGWRAAFGVAALGAPLAGVLIMLVLPARRSPRSARALFHFAPVIRAKGAMAFIGGYTVHCWELFGSRSWMVAFLTFAERASGGVWPIGPIAIAAAANLIGPFASIAGNEAALRAGRGRVIRAGMMASGVLTCTLGFFAAAPWVGLLGLMLLHVTLVMSDSSALTAGLVAVADPDWRGSAMALHSTFGFGAGFVSPLVFGAVLDAAGGNMRASAWGFAFIALGLGGVLAPLWLRWRNQP